ncbi:MAG TPA: ABC transporter permease [Erysipelotrichaceae bacterium]|nr:ABC transporter permease [Erysipelotrichaceae bacterium]
MKLAFSIAKRFLGYNKGQTIMIMVGIAIGVSVQIFIGLLITGLQESLIDKTVGSTPHITITQQDDLSFGDFEVNNDSFTAVVYQADGPAFAISENDDASILLRGLSSEGDTLYKLSEKLVEGKLPTIKNDVIIGSGLVEKLNVKLNDTLTLRTINNQSVDVRIVGIVDLKVDAINNTWVLSTLPTAQSLFAYDDEITSIAIQVKDVFEADVLSEELKDKITVSDLNVVNWKEQNDDLLSGLNGQSISSIMIQVFVLVSVVLGIASVLAITVLQKSKQIGILKAMGIPDNTASWIFLFQGLILGFYGAILGVLFGLGLIVSFTTFARNPDGSALIAIRYDIPFILFSGSIAIFSALIASFIPAARSKKLSPIEVIRNG